MGSGVYQCAREYGNPCLMSALPRRVLACGRAVQGAGWHAGPKLTSVSGPNKGFAKDAAFYPGNSEVSAPGRAAFLGLLALQFPGKHGWKDSAGCGRRDRPDGSLRALSDAAANGAYLKKSFCSVASKSSVIWTLAAWL